MQTSINFLEIIGGGKIPEVLVGTWLVMGILLIFGLLARRSLAAATDPIMQARVPLTAPGRQFIRLEVISP